MLQAGAAHAPGLRPWRSLKILPAFLKLAPAISKVDAVSLRIYLKVAIGRRRGVEAIGLFYQGERSNRGSYASKGSIGAIGLTRLEIFEP